MRRSLLLLLLSAAVLTLPALAWQDPVPVFGSDVRLVHIDIQVTERGTGRVVRGLTKNDFELRDNGETRGIAVFETEGLPLDAVLVMDITGEIGRNPRRDYTEGLEAIVGELRTGDRLAVISADNREVYIRSGLTDDEEQAKVAIRASLRDRSKLRRGGALLYESLKQAAAVFEGKPTQARRRVVLVLTQNRTKPNRRKLDRSVSDLLEADATVMGLVVPAFRVRSGINTSVGVIFRPPKVHKQSDPAAPNTLPEEHGLDPVADQTGGEILRFGVDVAFDWKDIMDRARSRYLAAFYAPPGARTGEVRQVSVRLTDEAARRCGDCLIRARARYTVK